VKTVDFVRQEVKVQVYEAGYIWRPAEGIILNLIGPSSFFIARQHIDTRY